ncbi:DNA mismatch repair protein [Mycena floridula]|nr:DNA mismatch repair protein [Mycena floridula]
MTSSAPVIQQVSAIQAIDIQTRHRITSGQVVIDLQTAVKELLENSLDAGATNIEVRFKNYGVKSIEVIDNGSGIAEKDHDSIALKHHTSKLNSFTDLETVLTFGFRGEALSSLCALCESVVVTTCVSPPMGIVLEMEQSGKVKSRTNIARQRGTTVLLTNPFLPLPVRRKEFERNAKREFGKALSLLSGYALGPCCGTGNGTGQAVRLTVSNQMDKGQKTVQLRTQGLPNTRASVTTLWGPKALEHLMDLDLKFTVEQETGPLKRARNSDKSTDSKSIQIVVRGLVSKFAVGCGRTGTDRQFFYVNSRPCNLTKIQKAFNEVYRSFNATQAPFIVADFIIPTECCDINVSPDKRTIFLHSEVALVTQLKAALELAFAPSRSTYDIRATQSSNPNALPGPSQTPKASTVQRIETHKESVTTLELQHPTDDIPSVEPIDVDPVPQVPVEPTTSQAKVTMVLNTSQAAWNRPLVPRTSPSPEILISDDEGHVRKKRKSEVAPDRASPAPKERQQSLPRPSAKDNKAKASSSQPRQELRQRLLPFARSGSLVAKHVSDDEEDELEGDSSSSVALKVDVIKPADLSATSADQSTDLDSSVIAAPSSTDSEMIDLTEDFDESQDPLFLSDDPSLSIIPSDSFVDHPEVIRTSGSEGITMSFNFTRIAKKWAYMNEEQPPATSSSAPSIPAEAGVTNTESDSAADALSRIIEKEDFGTMTVLGQFNLGFIVVRRKLLEDVDDLFIIDQHAADEKYNFETLQQTTNIKSQRLFRPQPLELTAADEMLAIENIEVLRQNGFEIDVEDEIENDGPSSRLKLVAQPVSKSTTFDMKDLEELIHLMHDHPTGRMVRCSKARAMFAMRACRKSVMVGMPLTQGQMTSVVQHMGTMEQPWNCPHGRPTMRHLHDLKKAVRAKTSPVDWSAFH